MAQGPKYPDDLPETHYAALDLAGYFSLEPGILARITLSAMARGLSDSARSLVPTGVGSGSERIAGHLVQDIGLLLHEVEALMELAVVVHRLRDQLGWPVIAAAAGITATDAETRYGPAVEAWLDAIDLPYQRDGDAVVATLPDAALRPTATAENLDYWYTVTEAGPNAEPVADGRPVSRATTAPPDDQLRARAMLLSASWLDQARRLLRAARAAPPGVASHPVRERVHLEVGIRAVIAEIDAGLPGRDATGRLDRLRAARSAIYGRGNARNSP